MVITVIIDVIIAYVWVLIGYIVAMKKAGDMLEDRMHK